MPAEVEAELRGAHRVSVRFRLRPEAGPLQVVGVIRNRRALPGDDPAAGSLVYGIEVDPLATRHSEDVKREIMEYLRHRERELLSTDDAETPEPAAA